MSDVSPRIKAARQSRELLVLSSTLGVVLWGLFAIDAAGGGPRGRLSGLPLGTDFVYFYTLAHVGASGRYAALESSASLHREQTRLVPTSADTPYPPVYPPQLAALLSPLARFSYWHAYILWCGLTGAVYGLMVWMITRGAEELRPWSAPLAATAAANPALWFTALHGQVSVLALTSLGLALAAESRKSAAASGAAFALLAYKPSLFAPMLAILLLAGEWRRAAAAVATVTVLFTLLLPWVGVAESRHYVEYLVALLRRPDAIASNPPLMHSLRTFWIGLAVPPVAGALYIVSAGVVLVGAAAVWRRQTTALDRIATASAAMVLATPHLFVYDLLILVPLLAAAAASLVRARRRWLGGALVAAYFAPIWGVPVAALGLQASTVSVAALAGLSIRASLARRAGPDVPNGRQALSK